MADVKNEVQSLSESPVQLSSLCRDGARSAFTPYRPSTILTNLQRGNVETQTPSLVPERSIFELAALGELFLHNIEDTTNIDESDENGFTPLMWASSYGQLATVKLLLAHGASPHALTLDEETPLFFASAQGHVSVIKELLKHSVDVNATDADGNTALQRAAAGNHALCVHELLCAGADFTAENDSSQTAYDLAVQRRNKQVQFIFEKYMMDLLLKARN